MGGQYTVVDWSVYVALSRESWAQTREHAVLLLQLKMYVLSGCPPSSVFELVIYLPSRLKPRDCVLTSIANARVVCTRASVLFIIMFVLGLAGFVFPFFRVQASIIPLRVIP